MARSGGQGLRPVTLPVVVKLVGGGEAVLMALAIGQDELVVMGRVPIGRLVTVRFAGIDDASSVLTVWATSVRIQWVDGKRATALQLLEPRDDLAEWTRPPVCH